MLVQPAKASLRVDPRSISTPTSEEQSADPAGSRSWTGRARSGTLRHARWEVVHAAQECHELLLGLRGYRFAANTVMPETNEGSSIAARSYNKVAHSPIFISDLQSPISTCGGGVSRGESTSFQGDALFLSHLQADLHPLFAPFCNLQSACLLYTSPSPRDVEESRMPSSA